jgi:hypothetical protein
MIHTNSLLAEIIRINTNAVAKDLPISKEKSEVLVNLVQAIRL